MDPAVVILLSLVCALLLVSVALLYISRQKKDIVDDVKHVLEEVLD